MLHTMAKITGEELRNMLQNLCTFVPDLKKKFKEWQKVFCQKKKKKFQGFLLFRTNFFSSFCTDGWRMGIDLKVFACSVMRVVGCT